MLPPATPNQSSPRPSPACKFPSIPKPAIVPVIAAGSVPGGQPTAASAEAAQSAASIAAAMPNPSPRAHARALLRPADMMNLTVGEKGRGRSGAPAPVGQERATLEGWGSGAPRLDLGHARPGSGRSSVRRDPRVDTKMLTRTLHDVNAI